MSAGATAHSRGNVGTWLGEIFLWCDKHDGGITALATVAIVVLTFVYSELLQEAMGGNAHF
jgi:hypothetical protein